MAEILAKFRKGNRYFLILDCGHWYKWSAGSPVPRVGSEFRCPSDKPIQVVRPDAPSEQR